MKAVTDQLPRLVKSELICLLSFKTHFYILMVTPSYRRVTDKNYFTVRVRSYPLYVRFFSIESAPCSAMSVPSDGKF